MTDSEIKQLEQLGNKIFRKNYKLTDKDLCDSLQEEITKEICTFNELSISDSGCRNKQLVFWDQE